MLGMISILFEFTKARFMAPEKAMAPHSSTLAWKIPWTEEPWGHEESNDWVTSLSLFTFMHWRRKWQPTPVFLPGESQGWGSLVGCHLWDRTESKRLKQVSSSRWLKGHFISKHRDNKSGSKDEFESLLFAAFRSSAWLSWVPFAAFSPLYTSNSKIYKVKWHQYLETVILSHKKHFIYLHFLPTVSI